MGRGEGKGLEEDWSTPWRRRVTKLWLSAMVDDGWLARSGRGDEDRRARRRDSRASNWRAGPRGNAKNPDLVVMMMMMMVMVMVLLRLIKVPPQPAPSSSSHKEPKLPMAMAMAIPIAPHCLCPASPPSSSRHVTPVVARTDSLVTRGPTSSTWRPALSPHRPRPRPRMNHLTQQGNKLTTHMHTHTHTRNTAFFHFAICSALSANSPSRPRTLSGTCATHRHHHHLQLHAGQVHVVRHQPLTARRPWLEGPRAQSSSFLHDDRGANQLTSRVFVRSSLSFLCHCW
ncbi:uncharacterized protein J3D65DRAFT_286980 [Phyllosticta citribraziliensis]|uniref:Uncharacterized protein n=1 Tax=Phyllosticta citribraziliensis TaxID=989973 RepID=A0ABR1LYA8_9PEZI